MTEQTKDLLKELLSDKFHSIDWDNDYIYNQSEQVINAAKELGFNALAEELQELI
jgi:hypothetical protein